MAEAGTATGAAMAIEAMGIEVVGTVTADGTAAGAEVVAAWVAIAGVGPAPAGVEARLCRSVRTRMKDDSPQEQDAFLNAMRSVGTSVSVYLVNGIRLVGLVQSFDRLLRSPTGVQLIYKRAISTIQPEPERGPVQMKSYEPPSSPEKTRAPVVVTRKRRSPPSDDT
jgi:host factor-I protein